MKKSNLLDIGFIVLCVAVLLPLVELGYSNIISRYSVILMLAAYFMGKRVAIFQNRDQSNKKAN